MFPDEPCEPTPGRIVSERNRYFTGKALTARDFTDEQAYFLSRHRLHNRLMHGWGVVCGLGVGVDPNPNPGCPDGLIVRKGIAIDGYGRELIVCCDVYLHIPAQPAAAPTPTPTSSSPGLTAVPATPPATTATPAPQPQPPGVVATPLGDAPIDPPPYVLCLFYGTDPFEYVPALYTDQTCDPYVTVPGRVRETPRLVFVSWEWFNQKVPGCWKTENDPTTGTAATKVKSPSWSDCATWTPDGCLQMSSLCGGMIPLAVITPQPAQNGKPVPPRIDTGGQHHLIVDPCRTLTHIWRFNWRHGCDIHLDALEHRGLVIEFDHPVRRFKGHRKGVNAFTFLVEYRTHGGHWLPLDFDEPPYLEDNGRFAVYRIHPKYFHARDHCRRVLGKMVRVTLKCDFIVDEQGLPVDGNFLKGRRPTGDGIPGGTFESWFRVRRKWPRHIAPSKPTTPAADETEQEDQL
jgi:hypothetical protein